MPEFTDAVYADLRSVARRLVAREFPGDALQPEALVHEAWLRLADRTGWENPGHFQAVAARVMRRILIDRWRQRRNRGQWAPLDEARHVCADPRFEYDNLWDILERLRSVDAEPAAVVEMKFFGGMTNREVAASMDYSTRTIRRQWASARLWLLGRMQPRDFAENSERWVSAWLR